MKVNIQPIAPPMTFDEFAAHHGLTMKCVERATRRSHGMDLPRWYAAFDHADVSDQHALVGVTGNGDTPAAAIADYVKRITGQLLVIGAWGACPTRREIQCPNEWLP